MDEPVVVREAHRDEVGHEELEALADFLRRDGIQAHVEEAETEVQWLPPVPFVETVCIWVAQGAVQGVGAYAATSAIKWAREQFLKYQDEGERVRVIEVVHGVDEDEGRVVHALELTGADAEPVAISPENFEEFTRSK